jgi:ABC-2 type transport system permease protein
MSSPIWALWAKERAEIRRNKLILITMASLPLILVLTVLGSDLMMVLAAASDKPPKFTPPPALAHLGAVDALLVLINDQYMFYLMMTPMILPTMIASHAVIGEKQARTLEPLLATPIATWEILTAKALAAAVPSTIIGWLSYGVTVLGIGLICTTDVFVESVRSVWLVGFVLVTPLLALFSTLFALAVSTRVQDVRVAQGISGTGVLPLIGFGTYIVIAKQHLSLTAMLVAMAVLLVLDVFLLWASVRLFSRESILCRWK